MLSTASVFNRNLEFHVITEVLVSLESIIALYGYPAILLGTFFEGETILLMAGFAAHQGYLQLPWVVLAGFLGTLCGDQLYFHIGRHRGTAFLEKRPYWKTRSKRIFDILERHQILLILGFRFVYGLRTVTPFVIGASGISPFRFFILNSVSGLLWASLIGYAGYLFGHALELLLGKLERYELLLFIAIAAVGMIIWGVHYLLRRKVSG